jgi:uncharacterized RDD family membrane protein YckC
MTTSDRLDAAVGAPAETAHRLRQRENELPADAVRRLLVGYGSALDTADSLPLLVRIATRPRRRKLFDGLRFFPQPTVGTATFVALHVRRSTAAIVRRYDRIAATRGLTEEESEARERVKTFNASLPEVGWKWIIPAGLIAIFVVTRLITGPVGAAANAALNSIYSTGITGDTVGALDKSVISALSSVPTTGSLMDLFAQFAKASPGELVTLASTIAIAGYLVLRPLASAFRIKRIILNLAAAGEVDLNRTTTTWNVARSVGLCQAEREVLAGLGARVPREFDVDLWISVIAAGVLLWGLWPGHIIERGVNGPSWVLGVVVAVTFAIARIAWLVRTGVLRRRTPRPVDPAAGLRLPATSEVVEARSVLETASLGFASTLFCWALPLNVHAVLPSPVWVRLVRERRDFERALAMSAGRSRRLPSASVWPAVGSAILLWLIPPVPLAIHLTHLARMQPPGIGSARRTRAWLVPLATVVLALFVLSKIPAISSGWYSVTAHLIAFVLFSAAFACVQHEHNVLAEHVAVPLPADDPTPAGALPRTAYTSWTRRVAAALIDGVPILILLLVAWGPLFVPSNCGKGWDCPLVVFDSLVGVIIYSFVATGAVAMMVMYPIWNWGYRQGRTGSTIGKSRLKFRVVSEKTGAPIGFWRTTLRLLLHAVDVLSLGVGFLLPLCDAKRRTLADEMMSTVCVRIPGADTRRMPEAKTTSLPTTG